MNQSTARTSNADFVVVEIPTGNIQTTLILFFFLAL